MTTQRELEEMAQDYEQMDRDRIKDMCRDLIKEELFEGLVAIEELRLLREGHTMLVPHDVEHARAMFKMACFYLTQYDPSFTLKHEGVK
jgi:hypothetical protein